MRNSEIGRHTQRKLVRNVGRYRKKGKTRVIEVRGELAVDIHGHQNSDYVYIYLS